MGQIQSLSDNFLMPLMEMQRREAMEKVTEQSCQLLNRLIEENKSSLSNIKYFAPLFIPVLIDIFRGEGEGVDGGGIEEEDEDPEIDIWRLFQMNDNVDMDHAIPETPSSSSSYTVTDKIIGSTYEDEVTKCVEKPVNLNIENEKENEASKLKTDLANACELKSLVMVENSNLNCPDDANYERTKSDNRQTEKSSRKEMCPLLTSHQINQIQPLTVPVPHELRFHDVQGNVPPDVYGHPEDSFSLSSSSSLISTTRADALNLRKSSENLSESCKIAGFHFAEWICHSIKSGQCNFDEFSHHPFLFPPAKLLNFIHDLKSFSESKDIFWLAMNEAFREHHLVAFKKPFNWKPQVPELLFETVKKEYYGHEVRSLIEPISDKMRHATCVMDLLKTRGQTQGQGQTRIPDQRGDLFLDENGIFDKQLYAVYFQLRFLHIFVAIFCMLLNQRELALRKYLEKDYFAFYKRTAMTGAVTV